MSQPQPQYPPRTYSPLQASSPPQNSPYGHPPSKRQRLSPGAQSPYNSPSMANIALPSQMYSGSFHGNGARTYGQPAHPTYNTFNPQPLSQQQQYPPPQQQTQAGNMGPPSKPPEKDRPTDMNELSDVLMGSGVDLKDEEAALLTSYNRDAAAMGNSFGSNHMGPMSNPSHTSHNYYSQNVPGGKDTFYGAGTFNQPAVPYQSAEEAAEAAQKRLVRRKHEMQQYHLNDPFLWTAKVTQKMSQRARNERVQVPKSGQYLAQSQEPVQQIVFGPDKHERLVTLKGQDLLNHDAPLSDMLALVSLAAQERLCSIIEDAAALAIERRRSSHGVVPQEFLDVAAVDGAVEAATGLPTPGNSAVSPKSNPLKRSYSDVNGSPAPMSNGVPAPPEHPTLPFNPLTSGLRDSFLAERKAEEERLTKRRRKEAATAASTADTPSSSGAATPGLLGDTPPEMDFKKPPTKKELKKQNENRMSDAQQAKATSGALNMALGGRKQPSWMTGAAAKPTNPMLPKVDTNTGATGGEKGKAGADDMLGKGLPRVRGFDFREDGKKGVGIQVRDLVFVMDWERKERRALAKAFLRLTED
ncbi:MAG: hypothetical protein LQ345_000849 [Seirophora villosa]|nr:MAG: hypothetical protein LQ345_000849 [Seirophora villosa]